MELLGEDSLKLGNYWVSIEPGIYWENSMELESYGTGQSGDFKLWGRHGARKVLGQGNRELGQH